MKYLSGNNVNFVALLETKVREPNKDKLRKMIGALWKWDDNYSSYPRGSIWIAWNPSSIFFQIQEKTKQMIHAKCIDKKTVAMFITAIYGQHHNKNWEVSID